LPPGSLRVDISDIHFYGESKVFGVRIQQRMFHNEMAERPHFRIISVLKLLKFTHMKCLKFYGT
jgi:hypothetical protein